MFLWQGKVLRVSSLVFYSLGQVTEERVEYLSFVIWAVPKCQGSSHHHYIKESLVELV